MINIMNIAVKIIAIPKIHNIKIGSESISRKIDVIGILVSSGIIYPLGNGVIQSRLGSNPGMPV